MSKVFRKIMRQKAHKWIKDANNDSKKLWGIVRASMRKRSRAEIPGSEAELL